MSLNVNTVNRKRLHWCIRKQHFLLRVSQDGERKKSFLNPNPLNLGMKKRYIIVSVIVLIMIGSVFAVLQNVPPTLDSITSINTEAPTAEPSPTIQQTPSATKKPTSSPSPISIPNNTPHPGSRRGNFPIIFESPERPVGIIESTKKMDSAAWKTVAQQAWQYFQPGVGIDPNTGLPGAVAGWPYFTDWDLGVYIQAVIDAHRLGLITDSWTADYRFEKVLYFLETRPLNEYGYPFWFYQAGDGQSFKTLSDGTVESYDIVDTGRLFVALNNLKRSNPDFALRVDDFVYRGRSNYTALLSEVLAETSKINTYAYYLTSGFAAFWPDEVGHIPRQILLGNIANLEVVTVNGDIGGNVTLPKARILCEPLLHSVFELDITDPIERSYLLNFSKQVYLAHEELNKITGQWVAFSEGNSGSGPFIYEWVYSPTLGSWKVTTIDRNTIYPINPIIYTKVALSFLALYNTTYAKNLSIYLEKSLPLPTSGWYEGADFTATIEERNIVNNVGSNTNGMILSASRYYVQNNP